MLCLEDSSVEPDGQHRPYTDFRKGVDYITPIIVASILGCHLFVGGAVNIEAIGFRGVPKHQTE